MMSLTQKLRDAAYAMRHFPNTRVGDVPLWPDALAEAAGRIGDLESALFGVLDSGVCRCGPECPEDCRCSFGIARRLMQSAPVPDWRDVEITDLRHRVERLTTALWPFSIQPHADWCAFRNEGTFSPGSAQLCNCGRYEAWRALSKSPVESAPAFAFRGQKWVSACGCLAGVFADPDNPAPTCTLCGADWVAL